jgi:hypothetical protein
MAANTQPIYSSVGDIEWSSTPLIIQNQLYDGSGSVATVFSASASGSFVQRVRFKASGSTTATVARIFINNGGDTTTAANNFLYDEITLSAVTATQTAATTVFELPMNIALPPAYRITATIGTTQIAGGGWYVGAIGGSYLPI